jgi:NADH:ubiquinone oxidoreductase subunit B-like Fe-S oxidoreductase
MMSLHVELYKNYTLAVCALELVHAWVDPHDCSKFVK